MFGCVVQPLRFVLRLPFIRCLCGIEESYASPPYEKSRIGDWRAALELDGCRIG
jgi:hypothetical protein